MVKNSPANAGDKRDSGSIPGSGRSPRVGNGNPLQYSCLENAMDRGAWQATIHRIAKESVGQNWATEQPFLPTLGLKTCLGSNSESYSLKPMVSQQVIPPPPSPPGLLFAQASQWGVKVLCQGVGFPWACILLWPMDVGEVRVPVPSGARKALNGFACFSQRFSLLLREDWAPGGCCHFTPDPRKNSWSTVVLAYSRTASLRTNFFFFL